ncbi:MAG: CDP-alcohol phosphatidyltransferase family protein [Candidatus Parcubacteria bacterium]|nr:CDP-alcohol phosphatidyltransferase family protein [Candidatus Parcubacteria bacterium]
MYRKRLPIYQKYPRIKPSDLAYLPLVKLTPKWITPNHLSLIRMMLSLPIILLIFLHFFKLAGIFFLVAAIMDGLDGALARFRNQETKLGAIIDPSADKAVNFMVWIGFLFYIKNNIYLGTILTIIIIDSCLFGIALFKFFIKDIFPKLEKNHSYFEELGMPQIIHQIDVSRTGANKWGKTKMVFQIIVISSLLLFDPATSIKFHETFTFLPVHLTLLHLSFPLLVICIVFGLLSLYGHIQVISFGKEEPIWVQLILPGMEEFFLK